MRIGIIVHSYSGNTLRVAEQLKSGLESAGHQVTVSKIRTLADYKPAAPVSRLAEAPAAAGFDALVLAGPVNAFGLSTALQAWLHQAAIPAGLPVAAFVTMGFPFAAWGGKPALRTLEELCRGRGVTLGLSRVLTGQGKRPAQVAELVRAFAGYFGAG